MNPYEFILPRLNGEDLEGNIGSYIKLVKKGIAGFILFGGRLEHVREGIKELERNARTPLLIASDLERGLGQQVEGGTVFPWAMAMGSALKNGINPGLLKRAFKSIALEAKWAGINLILAPVLDINSNPENPIIATRSFGEEPRIVSRLGRMMIREIQAEGLLACGKHFPGHGDTQVDSHLALPTITKSLKELERFELKPFKDAIKGNVKSIMPGHLKVPALDPSGLPATLSKKAIIYLGKMSFKGLVITDALNMAGIGMPEEKAAVLALRAGADILLHPSEPDKPAEYIKREKIQVSKRLLEKTRKDLLRVKGLEGPPPFEVHKELASQIALRAIRAEGKIGPVKGRTIVILSDEPEKLNPFIRAVKKGLLKGKILVNPTGKLPAGQILAVAHSTPRGWHPPTERLKQSIRRISERKPVWLSFGNPYLIYNEKNKILTYSDSEEVQRHMAEKLF
jgi:beta-glucosidase-like glycosyl hydrolase